MSRTCARPGCGHSAVATLSYAYGDRIVWLTDLAAEAHPMVHDLCAMHASSIRVPVGWELRDERPPTQPERLVRHTYEQADLVGA